MTYQELLEDPRWQEKRLRVFERDGFRCKRCGDDRTQLHIHHFYYRRELMPWEYPSDALITLCKLCHRKVEFVKWIARNGRKLLLKDGFALTDTNEIYRLIDKQLCENNHYESYVRYEEQMKALFQM